MPPHEVDAHELWEIAGYLGVNRPPDEGEEAKTSTDLLAERVKAAQAGRRVDPRSIAKPTQVGTLRPDPAAAEGR